MSLMRAEAAWLLPADSGDRRVAMLISAAKAALIARFIILVPRLAVPSPRRRWWRPRCENRASRVKVLKRLAFVAAAVPL
jgi:hypothetical protein